MAGIRWFPPATRNGAGSRAAWVSAFPPMGISGVYAIATRAGEVLYVGESHTGRLRKTLARHLQYWTPEDSHGEHFTYDRYRVLVAWQETTDGRAQDLEAIWINELQPRDNVLVPVEDQGPEPPF